MDFMWNIFALREQKFIQLVLVTWYMAVMPIYGKFFKFKKTVSQMNLKLGRQQKGLESYKSYINNDPGLS